MAQTIHYSHAIAFREKIRHTEKAMKQKGKVNKGKVMCISALPTRCRIFEKLIVTQLVKKSCFIYGTQRFITVLTRARHWNKKYTLLSSA
jgi:hypothetical protein